MDKVLIYDAGMGNPVHGVTVVRARGRAVKDPIQEF